MKACFQIAEHCLTTAKINLIFVTSKLLGCFLRKYSLNCFCGQEASGLIEQARSYVKTSVNTAEVYTKYYIGKYIVEYEQSGNVRAEYGKRVLKDLSRKLIARFEGGWSVDTLEKCRKLFLVYSKSATVLRNFEKRGKSATLLRILGQSENEVPDFLLSWSHYLILMRIKNDAERNFYEIECANQHWGG